MVRLRLVLLSLLSLSMIAAGPPVLSGSQPGSLRLYPKQLVARQANGQLPAITAPAAVLADSDSQTLIAARNPNQPRPMASTTKIMTALLVLEAGGLQETVTVQPDALIGGSSMGLAAGETLTVEDLLWGLLLNSGNDAAVALAQHAAGDEAAFVASMNRRAAGLGLDNTHYANAHGLDDPGHYSSAFDLWQLSETALAQPLFRQIVSTPTANVAGHSLWNRNRLLGLYPGADGVKTGTTDLAGECLVASVIRNGHRVIVVLLGSRDRYVDAEALFDHYFATYRWAAAPQPAGLIAWLRAADGQPYRLVAPDAPDLFLAQWQWPLLRIQPVLSAGPDDGSLPEASLRWYLGADLLAEAPAVWQSY